MVDAMQSHRNQVFEKLLACIKECSQANISVDLGQVVYDASFKMMFSTIFSLDSVCDEKVREIKDLMDCIIKEIGRPNIADCYPFLKVVDPQCIRHRLTSYCAKVFKLFDQILEVRLKSREELVKYSGIYNDLLDVIVEVMEEQRDDIKREHVQHLLLDLLGAGMNATSKTIEWAMTELLENPNVLQKLQEEIENVAGKGMNQVMESNIPQLPYLQAVVTETLRLHPTAPLLLPRKVTEQIEIYGFVLPNDSMLIVNTWAIGRDPFTWDDQDVFTPERFMGTKVDVKAQVIKLFTFGAGKKICPGMSLALSVSYLMLANLVSYFDWKLDDSVELHQDMGMLDDYFGITLTKTKSLCAFPTERKRFV
ncbi:Geraniol 8-hydroxylase [Bienertia sinuspersici]